MDSVAFHSGYMSKTALRGGLKLLSLQDIARIKRSPMFGEVGKDQAMWNRALREARLSNFSVDDIIKAWKSNPDYFRQLAGEVKTVSGMKDRRVARQIEDAMSDFAARR